MIQPQRNAEPLSTGSYGEQYPIPIADIHEIPLTITDQRKVKV